MTALHNKNIRLPDGSYNAPPGVATRLTQTSGLFRLEERFGAVLCACLLWLAFIGVAHAAASEQTHMLMDKSGIDIQIAAIPDMLVAGLRQAATQNPALQGDQAVQLRIESAVRESFAFAHMQAEIANDIENKLQPSDREAVMRWLGLPLGRRLTQLEKETAKPEAYAQMQVYAGTLKQSPPPARRVELLQALDTATGASRMAAQMLLDTRLALILGATSRMPEAERPSLAQIMDKVEQGRAAVEQVMPNQTLIQFLYVYRDVADADLQQYVEFARGDPARHFWQAGIEAMTQAFFASAEQFGQRLAEIHAKAGTERAL